MARSNGEEVIFRCHDDYQCGVDILHALSAEFELHGFCLNPTHYHLLGSFDPDRLSSIISRLNRRYATAFNRRHDRRGKVFDTPFKAVLVTRDEHYDYLPEYIAENPPRRPWLWSSYDREFSFVSPLRP